MEVDFNDFWTEKDDSIKIDFSFDPLGVMVIWRLFAQEIFGNKITTVANNMRYYLINLFNLTTIRILLRNDKIKEKYLCQHYDETKFRDDLIIFLENLFIYCSSEKNVNPVPGVAKYKALKDKKKYIICFEGKPEKYEILTRQLQLGISGRYKTPFKEMGLDYNDIIKDNIVNGNWEKASLLIEEKYNSLIEKIVTFLEEKEFSSCIQGKEISDICSELIKVKLLNASTIPDNLSNFLLKKIGLTDDTAKILYDIVKEYKDNEDKDVNVKDIFEEAEAKTNDEKIKNIIALESFLAPIQHAFDGIIETNNEDLSDYKKLEEKLPNPNIEIDIGILDKSETAKKRFFKLKEIVRSNDKIKKLIEYHNKVQEERGSPAWVFVDENNKINRVKLVGTRTKLEDWLKKSEKEKRFDRWKNDYYISSLKSIMDSMGSK
ncbi:hypothetical protein [Deferribacter abyssi]|uniref:hypothetical protein n=1 Tax=Deferribacter abyssi TaxID=213806 RepID=UPI003C2034F4